jgi:hypothetical protein
MQHQEQQLPLSEQPDFTIVEAAAVTGRSRITIRRYLDAGRFPNAFRDAQSVRKPAPWRISAQDLRRIGLSITEPQRPDEPASVEAESCEERAARLEVESAVNLAVAAERDRTVGVLVDFNRRLLDAVVELATRP